MIANTNSNNKTKNTKNKKLNRADPYDPFTYLSHDCKQRFEKCPSHIKENFLRSVSDHFIIDDLFDSDVDKSLAIQETFDTIIDGYLNYLSKMPSIPKRFQVENTFVDGTNFKGKSKTEISKMVSPEDDLFTIRRSKGEYLAKLKYRQEKKLEEKRSRKEKAREEFSRNKKVVNEEFNFEQALLKSESTRRRQQSVHPEKAKKEKKKQTRKIEVALKLESAKENRARKLALRAAKRAELLSNRNVVTESGASTTPLLKDLREIFQDSGVMQALCPKDKDYAIDMLSGVILYSTQLLRSRDLLDVTTATYQYLRTFNFGEGVYLHNKAAEIADLIWRYCSNSFKKIVTESGLDSVDLFFDIIMESKFATSLFDIFLSLVSFKIFDSDFSSQIKSYFGSVKKMPIAAFVKKLISAFRDIYRLFLRMKNGVPFCKALMAEDPVTDLSFRIKELMIYENFLYTGLPVEGYKCIKEYCDTGEKLLEEGDKLLAALKPFNKDYSLLKETHLRLKTSIMNTINQMISNGRAAPLAILLQGSPGVGKGRVLPLLCKWYSDIKGRDFSDSQIFGKVPSSDYWEGYNPPSHPYIHISEGGNLHRNIAGTHGDPSINMLMSLIDSLAMPLDMAALEKKGKIYANPELVIIDTNNPTLNRERLLEAPSALARRFCNIEQIVKPQYRREDSCEFDYSKTNDDIDTMDRYIFNVYKEYAIDCKTSRKVYLAKNIDIFELRTLMSEEYKKFIVSAENMEKDVKSSKAYKATSESGIVQNWKNMAIFRTSTFYESFKDSLYDSFNFLKFNCAKSIDLTSQLSKALILTIIIWLLSRSMKHRDKAIAMSAFVAIFGLVVSYVLSSFTCFFTVMIFLIMLNEVVVFETTLTSYLEDARNRCFKDTNRIIHLLWRYHWTGNPFEVNLQETGLIICSSIVSLLGIYILYKKTFQKEKKIGTEVSQFSVQSELHREVNQIEKDLLCGNSYKRIPNKIAHQIWNTQIVEPFISNTLSLNEFYSSLYNNIRLVRVEINGEQHFTHIFGVKENIAIVNSHSILNKSTGVQLHVYAPGSTKSDTNCTFTTIIEELNVLHAGNDVSLVKLSGVRFKDKFTHLLPSSGDFRSGKAMISGIETRAYFKQSELAMSDSRLGDCKVKPFYEYNFPGHKSGDCGLPIVASHGSGTVILGIHCAGDTLSHFGFATSFDQNVLGKAIDSLNQKNPFMRVHSERDIVTPCRTYTPHPKSPWNFVPLKSLPYYGNTGTTLTINQKSRLRRQLIGDRALEVLETNYDFIPTELFGRPMMQPTNVHGKYISPYNIALEDMNFDRKGLNPAVMAKVVDVLSERIILGLKERSTPTLAPLDVLTAINSVSKDGYLRRMNASTGSGFGFEGKKSKHIPKVTEEIREPSDELLMKVKNNIQGYMDGISQHPVYRGLLKDEPRAIKKIAEGKTRMFFMQPIDALIIHRMFLAPYYTLMVEHGDLFCSSVGTNFHQQADAFVKEFLAFSELEMEGDYKKFDKEVPPDISAMSNTVTCRVLAALGYSQEAIQVLRGVLSDGCFPIIEVLGDIFEASGQQPSGKGGTAEENSQKNLLMLMYFWYSQEETCDMNFFDYVKPRTYGDDLLASVKKAVSHIMNNNNYARFCATYFGMTYTSATKSDTFEDFISVEEMSFLKRRFVFSTKFNRWLAPLDMNSIFKSLNWRLPSNSINEETQVRATVTSALWELFFHSDERTYSRVRSEFVEFVADLYSCPVEELEGEFPTYEKIVSSLGW